MKKKSISFLALLLVLAMILTACGGAKNDAPAEKGEEKGETQEAAETTEEPGREDGVLDVCIASEPNSIDPAINSAVDGAVMLHHAFEGLIKWVDDGQGNAVLAPGQAESWDASEDGLKWTFHLRDGITWTDGKPVTAQDFVFAWNRLVDPITAADYSYMLDMVKGYDEQKLAISAPDEKTLEVELSAMCPYFEEIMAFPATFPVREDIVAKEDWTTTPDSYISNGPYKMTEWNHNQNILMEKRDDYYDAATIKAPKINFHLQDDINAMYASYRSGELDFIESVPTEETTNLLSTGELKVKPYIGTYYVSFNNQLEPFNNPKVREAFSLAVDRNFIVEKVTASGQVPAAGFVPAGIADATEGSDFRTVGGDYYSVKPEDYEANCEKARELLKEAGFENGEGFPVVEFLYNTSESHKAIAEALQNMWQEQLGVQVTLQNQEWNVFLTERKNGNYSIARDGWIADYNDPMSFLDMFLTGGGNNNPQYSNPKFDEIIKKAKVTSDPAERFKLMHEAEDIAFGEDVCAAPLYYYVNTFMMKPNITGLYYTPLGYFFYGNTEGF